MATQERGKWQEKEEVPTAEGVSLTDGDQGPSLASAHAEFLVMSKRLG